MRTPWCWQQLCVVVLAFAPVRCPRAQSGSPAPEVKISTGVLQGTHPGAGGAAFLGVPYAAPPVGDLRWNGLRLSQSPLQSPSKPPGCRVKRPTLAWVKALS
jgi:hypothetical protein